MNILNRNALLLTGAFLLCVNVGAQADDIEDANKLFKQGQRSQALDKINDYLANKPKDAQARFLKGLILTEQGKTADAIKVFTALTEDYPELPEPYNNLAVLYAGQSQYDKAKQLLEKAISTHPSYATAHENLGDIYAKMASEAYDRALQLDHGNAATQTKLAMIQNLFAGGARNKETPVRSNATPNNAEEAAPVQAAKSQPEPVQPALAPVLKTKAAVSRADPEDKNEIGKEVMKTVTAWAAAWSAKKADKYLSFYADDFKTPGGETRAAWAAVRKDRINKPKRISVGVHNMTVQVIDSDHATAKFRQTYYASHLKTSDHKTLLMEKSGHKWLIQEEQLK